MRSGDRVLTMGRRAKIVLAPALLAAGSACGDARFEVEFEWVEGSPPSGDLFLRVEVEDAQGNTVRQAGPERFRPEEELRLELDEIPIGEPDLVLYAEFRDSEGSAGRVLYYGISQRFELPRGEEIDVQVRVPVRAAPSAPAEGAIGLEGALRFGGQLFVASPEVTLRLGETAADQVEVSNRPFSTDNDGVSYGLGELRREGGQLLLPWDLDHGLAEPCQADNACPRELFVRFVDGEGYRSRVYDVGDLGAQDLIVDTADPSIIAGSDQLTMIPEATNPLVQGLLTNRVTKATAGTRVRLSFIPSEPLALNPVAVATGRSSGEQLDLTASSTTSVFVYDLSVGSDDPDDVYDVEVSLVDRAGRGALLARWTFEVDRTPPLGLAASVAAGQPALVHERAPFGSAESVVPTYSVVGPPGAIEPGATLIFLDGPDPEADSRLGETQAGLENTAAPGAVQGELVRRDEPQVFALVIDQAGNVSGGQAELVERGRWTAGFLSRVAGSPSGNPNVFEGRPWLLDSLRQARSTELGEAEGVGAEDGRAATTFRGGTWESAAALEAPPDRFWGQASFDPTNGRLLYFGGRVNSTASCDATGNDICGTLWAFDGTYQVLTSNETSGSINPRERHAQAYDSRRGELVVFGGKGAVGSCGVEGSAFCSDTWTFGDEGWRLRAVEGSSPAQRVGHVMAYDSSRAEVVLFGGTSENGRFCDPDSQLCRSTWRWDGASWEQAILTDEQPAPPPRVGAAMAYDAARGRVVLFGGSDDTCDFSEGRPNVLFGDTWEWDGGRWERLGQAAPGPQPNPRDFATLTYHPGLGRVVLYGGNAGSGNSCDDSGQQWCDTLWSWTGDGWEMEWSPRSLRFEGSPAPVGRSDHGMAMDAFGRLVVFGGRRVSRCDDEFGEVAQDCSGEDGATCSGTWAYDAGSRLWVNLAAVTEDHSPPARREHGLAYMAGTGRALLFGGRDEGRRGCGAGPNRDECEDTWVWNGSEWTRLQPAVAPSNRQGHRMLWDADAGRVLSIGGFSGDRRNLPRGLCDGTGERDCLDFWTFDPVRGWARLAWGFESQSGQPEGRSRHGAALEPATGRLIVANGTRNGALNGQLGDGWALAQNRWTASAEAPSPREHVAMAYRTADRAAVLFGGFFPADPGECPMGSVERPGLGDCYFSETWIEGQGRWSQAPASSVVPTPRSEAVLVDAPEERALLMFGGFAPQDCGGGALRCGDLWLYRDSTWIPVESANLFGHGLAPARFGHAMVYDSDRRNYLVFGGSPRLGDTWKWHPPLGVKPAHVARFRLGSAFVGVEQAIQVSEAALRWVGGSTRDGVAVEPSLLLWLGDGWSHAVEASGSGLDDHSWTTADTNLLARMITGASLEMGFGLVPSVAPDNEQVEVSTDFVELTVSYRHGEAP